MNYPELVDAAIAANRANRTQHADAVRGLYLPQYLQEFATVRINIGRGVGKTKYTLDRVRPWDMVIVGNKRMADQQYRHLKNLIVANGPWSLDRLRGRHLVPRTVYIDEPAMIAPRELAELYLLLAGHPDQTFVLLG